MASRRADSQRGRSAELRVMEDLVEQGWLCGHRRHIGGAGDVLATRWTLGVHQVMLVEVKSRKYVWQGFRREERIALVNLAAEFHATPMLASLPPGAKVPLYYPQWKWPSTG